MTARDPGKKADPAGRRQAGPDTGNRPVRMAARLATDMIPVAVLMLIAVIMLAGLAHLFN